MNSAEATILSASIGKVLVGACRADYLIDGVPNDEDAGPLQLEFADGSKTVLSLVPDGENVTAETTALQFSPETWFRIELSSEDSWAHLINQTVTGCDEWIWDREIRTGWRIWFDDQSLCYINAGDYAKIEINSQPRWPTSGCEWRVIEN